MICAEHGPPERHKDRKAQKTIKEQKATWKATLPTQEGELGKLAFWLPIDGYPDYYLHFGVAYAKDYIRIEG